MSTEKSIQDSSSVDYLKQSAPFDGQDTTQITSLNRLDQRFSEFSSLQAHTVSAVLSTSVEAISQWDPTEKAIELTEAISDPILKTIAQGSLERYIETEKTIAEWEQKPGLNYTDALIKGLELPTRNVQIERIHGGYAIVLSPKDFASYLGISFVQNGGSITDPGRVEDILKHTTSQAGILLDDSEVQGRNLPAGFKVAIIADTICSQQAVIHEENEVIGSYIDAAIEDNNYGEALQRFIPSGLPEDFDRDSVRVATHDLAARIEDGADDISLANLGVSPDYSNSHPIETKLLSSIVDSINFHLQSEDIQREELVKMVRGGSLRVENLAKHLLQTEDLSSVLAIDEFSETEEIKGKVIQSEKKGRFVYNQGTLKKADELISDNTKYTIDSVLGEGGMGVVYRATRSDGKVVVVKEVIYTAPEALITDEDTAAKFISGLIKKHSGSSNAPLRLINEVVNLVGDSKEFGKIFKTDLEVELSTRFGSILNADGKPLYRGNFQFSYLDSQGQPPQADIQRQISNAVFEVAKKFAETSQSQQLLGGLEFLFEKFIKESETLHTLSNIKGIAGSFGIKFSQIRDASRSDWHCAYMIQEFVDGENLENKLQLNTLNPNLMNIPDTVLYVSKLLGILEQAHKKGVIHKDIKPSNTMINTNGEPVLLDFGIAKSRFEDVNVAQNAGARSGTTELGSEGYNSPEHFKGQSDARTDVYSTGIMLYQLITGEHPALSLDGLTFAERVKYIQSKLGSRDKIGNRIFSQELEDIILKAIQIDPNNRYQTAADMAKDLEKFLQPAPIVKPVTVSPVSQAPIIPVPVLPSPQIKPVVPPPSPAPYQRPPNPNTPNQPHFGLKAAMTVLAIGGVVFGAAKFEESFNNHQSNPPGKGNNIDRTPSPLITSTPDAIPVQETNAMIQNEKVGWIEALGVDVEVPPIPDYVTYDVLQKLEANGFALRYMPDLNLGSKSLLSSMSSTDYLNYLSNQYPSWKKTKMLDANFWNYVKNGNVKFPTLSGGWTAVETVPKPESDGLYASGYGYSYIGNMLKLDDRFAQPSYQVEDAITKYGASILSDLKISNKGDVRLLSAMEWNLLGNREGWDKTDLWEWTSTKYTYNGGGEVNLVTGDSNNFGEAKLGWDDIFRNDIGWRVAIDLGPSTSEELPTSIPAGSTNIPQPTSTPISTESPTIISTNPPVPTDIPPTQTAEVTLDTQIGSGSLDDLLRTSEYSGTPEYIRNAVIYFYKDFASGYLTDNTAKNEINAELNKLIKDKPLNSESEVDGASQMTLTFPSVDDSAHISFTIGANDSKQFVFMFTSSESKIPYTLSTNYDGSTLITTLTDTDFSLTGSPEEKEKSLMEKYNVKDREFDWEVSEDFTITGVSKPPTGGATLLIKYGINTRISEFSVYTQR